MKFGLKTGGDFVDEERYTEQMGIEMLKRITLERHEQECIEQTVREELWGSLERNLSSEGQELPSRSDSFQIEDEKNAEVIALGLTGRFRVSVCKEDILNKPFWEIIREIAAKFIKFHNIKSVLER